MNSKKKLLFNAVIFFAVFGLTIWGVFGGEDLTALYEALTDCQVIWLAPAVVCVFIFIWGESIIIWYMMHSYGIRLRKRTCFLFSSVGFFFSCITPSASGGQPMQIYYMKKENIPVPVATVILMIVTITYKAVLVVTGIGIIIFGRGFSNRYLTDILPVFYLGIGLNVFCVTSMLILVFHPSLAKNILVAGMKLLEKMHLLKKKENRLQRLEESMDSYKDTAAFMKTHVWLMINVLLISFGQRIALFAVTCFVYRSFGLSGISWFDILMLQATVSIAVDMLPLPGGMGISETLFLAIFPAVFGELLLPGMIISRGLGYYSELLISAFFTLVTLVVYARKEKRAGKPD